MILYTSGSTGKPKGVAITRHAVINVAEWYADYTKMTSDDVYGMYTTYVFDMHALALYPILTCGASLVVISEETRLSMYELNDLFVKEHVTQTFITTHVGKMFVEMDLPSQLRFFCMAGEKLGEMHAPEHLGACDGYGPTESLALVSAVDVNSRICPYSVGKPINNVKVYILDKEKRRIPCGAVGELYLCGHQLSTGYINRKEQNEASFFSNPFASDDERNNLYDRIYATGDFFRYLPDGTLGVIGRRDGQIKIRGNRIELTEVASVIGSMPGIEDVFIQPMVNDIGEKDICAYVVLKGGFSKDDIASHVKSYVVERKPSYMVPTFVIAIDRMPLNVNGKVDKRSLPKPNIRTRRVGRLPTTETEKTLCRIMAEVLGLEQVYADDDFFNIGGTSLNAYRVIMKCHNCGINIVYRNIFDNHTPESLDRLLSGNVVVTAQVSDGKGFKSNEWPLMYNSIEYVGDMSCSPIGDVLLTGATGFLGVHVLRELLSGGTKVTCLVRGSNPENRLIETMRGYFAETIGIDGVTVIGGDITEPELSDKLSPYRFDTIINCAANVKHFSHDESLDIVNNKGVINLIDIALDHGSELVHVSTFSVGGESVNGSVPDDVLLRENAIDIGQNLDNKYNRSKYLAECAILSAIRDKHLRAKIFRAGNLMGRHSDGRFQRNFANNWFMKRLESFNAIGCVPRSMIHEKVDFSPVDFTAKALLLASGTPERYTVFNGSNPNLVEFDDIIGSMNSCGMGIDIVSDIEFNDRVVSMIRDEKDTGLYGLLTEGINGSEKRRDVLPDTRYSKEALRRIGFEWPNVDGFYLERVFKQSMSEGHFANSRNRS